MLRRAASTLDFGILNTGACPTAHAHPARGPRRGASWRRALGRAPPPPLLPCLSKRLPRPTRPQRRRTPSTASLRPKHGLRPAAARRQGLQRTPYTSSFNPTLRFGDLATWLVCQCRGRRRRDYPAAHCQARGVSAELLWYLGGRSCRYAAPLASASPHPGRHKGGRGAVPLLRTGQLRGGNSSRVDRAGSGPPSEI